MCAGDKVWINRNKAPLKLWQTQLNVAVFCASIACEVNCAHLTHAKHPMVRALYRFHVYYHVRQVLKRLQVLLPQEASFDAYDNPFINEEFFKICEDYGVPHDPIRDEKFYCDLSAWRWTAG